MADDYLSPAYVQAKPVLAGVSPADQTAVFINTKQYGKAFKAIDNLVNAAAEIDKTTENQLISQLKAVISRVNNPEIRYKALLTLGALHNKVGNITEAITVYAEAMRLKPGEIEPPLRLGQIHEYLTEYDNALDCYEIVLKLAPQNAKAKQRIEAIKQIRAEYQQLLERR